MADQTSQKSQSLVAPIVFFLIWATGALLAFYLSWSCNSHWGRGTLAKLFFAVMCSFQSWGYAVTYFFYKRGLCDPAAFRPIVRA